jgi:hypothetical protein
MIDPSMVYVAIITTVGGLIGLLLYQRGNLTTWAMRMDYKQAEYTHKEKMEDLRKKAQQKMQSIKQTNPKDTGGFIEILSKLDTDKIGDIVDNVKDLADGTGEGGWIESLLPMAKGVLQGLTGKKKQGEEEEGEELIR